MSFKIVRNDITKMNTEVIVNTANANVDVGPGCDSAIYLAAGYDELLNYRKEHVGFVEEGEVFITPGFHLRAQYIIHAVSPCFRDGAQGEEEKLRACYKKSLQLAKENHVRSIAFPLIATGGFGYPKEEGMRIAIDAIDEFLLENEMDIFLVVFDEKATELGENLFPDLEAYIDQNYVDGAREREYGAYPLNRNRGESFASRLAPAPANVALKSSEKYRAPKASFLGSIFKKEAKKSESMDEMEALSMDTIEESVVESVSESQKSSREKNLLNFAEQQERTLEASLLNFTEQHESKLEERMRHMSDTYSQYLMYLIQERNMENAEVYKRAIVDKKIFSKIKNNANYHPNKMTALCLCVGAKLNLDESRDLLARAGYALSPCDKTDIIFSYFIENEIYDMIELDIQLEEHGLPCIIS